MYYSLSINGGMVNRKFIKIVNSNLRSLMSFAKNLL